MRLLGAILACTLLVTIAAPAGSQDGAVVVRPRVFVRTDQPPPPPPEIESFGITLVVTFWVEVEDKQVLAIEMRCAAPEYRAKIAKSDKGGQHELLIEGQIRMLRDREILLLFETSLITAADDREQAVELVGSAILRDGEDEVLMKTEGTALHASFTFEKES